MSTETTGKVLVCHLSGNMRGRRYYQYRGGKRAPSDRRYDDEALAGQFRGAMTGLYCYHSPGGERMSSSMEMMRGSSFAIPVD